MRDLEQTIRDARDYRIKNYMDKTIYPGCRRELYDKHESYVHALGWVLSLIKTKRLAALSPTETPKP